MGPVESNETFPSAFIIKIHSHCIIFWFLYTLSLFDDFFKRIIMFEIQFERPVAYLIQIFSIFPNKGYFMSYIVS